MDRPGYRRAGMERPQEPQRLDRDTIDLLITLRIAEERQRARQLSTARGEDKANGRVNVARTLLGRCVDVHPCTHGTYPAERATNAP